jgi:hypothetical protein
MTFLDRHSSLADSDVLTQGEYPPIEPSAAGFAWETLRDPQACVCPVVAAFLGAWADDLSQEERGAVFGPLSASAIGSRNASLETPRGLLLGDWLVRTQAPAWLRLAGAHIAAGALERMPEVADMAGVATLSAPLKTAQWVAVDIRDAAWATPAGAATAEERAAHLGRTWDAPWAIAAQAWSNVGLEEARAATAVAALEAARAAVWGVADLRAHADVWNLAYETSRIAAHAGFCLAGAQAVRDTRDGLKRSAAERLARMLELR